MRRRAAQGRPRPCQGGAATVAVPPTCEGRPDPQGHGGTRPPEGVRRGGEGWPRVIDLAAEGRDTRDGGHGLLQAREGCTRPPSVENVHAYGHTANEYYWSVRD